MGRTRIRTWQTLTMFVVGWLTSPTAAHGQNSLAALVLELTRAEGRYDAAVSERQNYSQAYYSRLERLARGENASFDLMIETGHRLDLSNQRVIALEKDFLSHLNLFRDGFKSLREEDKKKLTQQLEKRSATEVVVKLLRSSNPELQERCADVIGQVGIRSQNVLNVLKEVAEKDQSPRVRTAASRAIKAVNKKLD